MKPFILKSKTWVLTHKKTSAVLALVLVVLIYGAFQMFSKGDEETRYVLATVERGSIISSISGTGQVSASNQVDVSAKASGDLIYLNAKAGQEVKAGTLIAQLDAGDAAYELETAEISYAELVNVDADDLRDAERAVTDATEDLNDAYTDARASLTSASTDMADVLASVDELFSGYLSTTNNFSLSKTSKDYIDRAEESYYAANKLQKEFIKQYRIISASTPREDIEKMISESYQISVSVAQATKYAQDAVVYLRDREDNNQTEADEAYSTVTGLVADANAVVSSLSSAKSSLSTSKRALEDAERDLEDLKAGPDTLDLRSEELSLRQKREALADYYVRAPFDGVIASVDAHKGDSMNSGATIATLITKQKVAEISLNEIDVAKVEVGQKATLTFDALEELTISGQVVEVDMVGTVSSGVVNYTVKIGFDTDDDKVKPGMTVTANIITEMKQDVLAIPVSAVKTQGNISYVEVVNQEIPQGSQGGTGVLLPNPPSQVEVVTGLSNDETIEIVSGLEEGQQYVSRTVTTNSTATQSTQSAAPSLFGGSTGGGRPSGGFGGGGGNFPR
ncbi:MAG: efflux RND transporter periplasmic adaptor subunit [Candidatus Pacebacteria bacterium]|nr:efflux RND transporter periplasmic adaptor subunit [Candidatus Paceibacterota bacterium]MCD8563611.1 efflux RND transporter periplasmic adaptor subunit [Candidatus Paceibacterota bacterium]